MSAFSEAWHDASPAIRDFYRNWSHRHTQQLNRWIDGVDPITYEYFNYIVGIFHRPLGKDVFYAQMTFQLWEWGFLKPEIVLWCDWGTFTWQGPMPCRGVVNFPTWFDQYIDIPDFAVNYPRDKRKAPKQYWTGAPRRRQNLP